MTNTEGWFILTGLISFIFYLKKQACFKFWRRICTSRSISIVPIFHTWMPFDKCRSIGVHVVSKCSWIRRCVFLQIFWCIKDCLRLEIISRLNVLISIKTIQSVSSSPKTIICVTQRFEVNTYYKGIPNMNCDIQWLP